MPMSLPIVLEIRARREQSQFVFVCFLNMFYSVFEGLAESRIYLYVTDDDSGNKGRTRTSPVGDEVTHLFLCHR